MLSETECIVYQLFVLSWGDPGSGSKKTPWPLSKKYGKAWTWESDMSCKHITACCGTGASPRFGRSSQSWCVNNGVMWTSADAWRRFKDPIWNCGLSTFKVKDQEGKEDSVDSASYICLCYLGFRVAFLGTPKASEFYSYVRQSFWRAKFPARNFAALLLNHSRGSPFAAEAWAEHDLLDVRHEASTKDSCSVFWDSVELAEEGGTIDFQLNIPRIAVWFEGANSCINMDLEMTYPSTMMSQARVLCCNEHLLHPFAWLLINNVGNVAEKVLYYVKSWLRSCMVPLLMQNKHQTDSLTEHWFSLGPFQIAICFITRSRKGRSADDNATKTVQWHRMSPCSLLTRSTSRIRLWSILSLPSLLHDQNDASGGKKGLCSHVQKFKSSQACGCLFFFFLSVCCFALHPLGRHLSAHAYLETLPSSS